MSSIWSRIFGAEQPSSPPPTPEQGAVRGPDVVRLEPAVPGEVDDQPVVATGQHTGLYTVRDGTEIHEAYVFLQLPDGQRVRAGIGTEVVIAGEPWLVTAFEADEVTVLSRASSIDMGTLVVPEGNPEHYPDAEVCNLWVQTKQPVATWVADLSSAARTDPEAINRFVDALLAAGVQTGVVRIHEAPDMDFYEDTHGPFPEWFAQRRQASATPDLLSELGGHRQTAVLSTFDDEGRLVDGVVMDLGTRLKAEEPYERAFDGFMEPFFAVCLIGSYPSAIAAAAAGDWDRPVQMRISTHSDIWFPWINGANHPLCDYKRKFDNRLLAERNAPRLNAFLEAVAEAAQAAGGTLELDRDETNVRPEYVSDRGVVLDVDPPAAIFTEDDRNIDWD